MPDELERYWFVAAVFRQPQDVMATVAELGRAALAGDRLLVVSRGTHDGAFKAAEQPDHAAVHLVTMHADGAWHDGDGRMPAPRAEFCSILQAMEESAGTSPGDGGVHDAAVVRNGQGQIYAQLRRDVADGAFVLIASVADAQEQLQGARILLRGNCECVLMHELAVQRP